MTDYQNAKSINLSEEDYGFWRRGLDLKIQQMHEIHGKAFNDQWLIDVIAEAQSEPEIRDQLIQSGKDLKEFAQKSFIEFNSKYKQMREKVVKP